MEAETLSPPRTGATVSLCFLQANSSIPSFYLCEETTCSVCVDYFKDPVTLDCGHNFCKACLTQTWEKSSNIETSCPQCRGIVSQKNFRTNQSLANIVEKVKILSLQGSKKAKGKERVCEKHQEPLNLFCTDDETFICVVCDRNKEHQDHRRIPLGTGFNDLPDNPERFSPQVFALGHEGFTSGRHFWEVVVEGEGDWAVGVARASVRKKDSVNVQLGDGVWVVGKWRGRYHATSWPSSTDFLLSEKTKRVRVCLNYTSNQVGFYDADTEDQICIFSNVPFSGENALPFFFVKSHRQTTNRGTTLWPK
uniref:Zinc finger protein RFP-like n=1 Tax=Anolis carolinensis TaxID=28377 RepID=A0A803SVP9_ANOCA